jgi:ubiquinone/menaquinone biosynthesis C-methylase UbiE
MSFYGNYIFPFFMDLAMRGSLFREFRGEVLLGVRGETLEIGAGTGLNFEFYPPEVTRLVTVDPNEGMSAKAKKRGNNVAIDVEYVQLSAEKLPFPDESFDFVISTWTLCSIPQIETALAEVFRVLRKGGEFRYVEHGLAPEKHVRKWQAPDSHSKSYCGWVSSESRYLGFGSRSRV